MAYSPPIFNDAVNDLTGTSVTLTITPPTDAGYVQTHVLYRRISGPNGVSDLIWGSGGVYVGIGGVSGTFQVSGLTADHLTEFILYAEYTPGFSPPSIPRRVTVSDSGQPVVARILEDMKNWLLSIQTINGFNYDMQQVKIIRTAGQAMLDAYPGAIIYADRDRYQDAYPVGEITHHVIVIVEGWVAAYEDVVAEDALEKWGADIEMAILEGRRRGGEAVTTSVNEVARALTDGAEPFGGIILEVDVHYITDFGNPYQRR